MATAGKFGGAGIWLLVSGYNMVSNKFNALRAKVESMTEETTGAGDSWREVTPVGLTSAEVVQEGAYFDTQTGFVHDMQAAYPGALTPQTTPRVVTGGFEGHVLGGSFFGAFADYNFDYEVLSKVGALERANLSHGISGQFDWGQIVALLTSTASADVTGVEAANSVDNTTVPQRVVPITSSSATGEIITTTVPHGLTVNDTVLITSHAGSTPALSVETVSSVPTSTTFGIVTNITVGGTGGTLVRAATANGYAAYLQWTALTLGGHTGAVVTVRHSVDNSTFADLVSFTAATATRGGERKTATATVVRRYLAHSVDFTGAGSPSMNYFVGLARL